MFQTTNQTIINQLSTYYGALLWSRHIPDQLLQHMPWWSVVMGPVVRWLRTMQQTSGLVQKSQTPKKTEQLEKIRINIDKPWYTIKFWTTQFSDIQESRTLLFWKPRRVMVYVDGWWTQVSGQKLKPSLSSCCPLLQKEESNIINLVVQQGQFTSVYYAQRMW